MKPSLLGNGVLLGQRKPFIFIGMPAYGSVDVAAAQAFYVKPTFNIPGAQQTVSSSLLARGFNALWSLALNAQETPGEQRVPITAWAMLHGDVIPESGWAEKLHGIMIANDAACVSAVVPIKTDEGLTSTAIDSADDPWRVEKRLTMREVMSLPMTFDAASCGFPDRRLLVNTGCMIVDFTKPWRHEVAFEIRDRIIKKDGKWTGETMPEDWNFSRALASFGGKVLATREVALTHAGVIRYPNNEAWGSLATDAMVM